MCLIVFAWQAHPRYPLVLAANRDEYFSRPTRALHYWDDLPNVLGGRDLEKGGGWCAAHTDGRWAAVTNFRDGAAPQLSAPSRGDLVRNYMASDKRAREYVDQVIGTLTDYPGCNLLVGDDRALYFVTNRAQGINRAQARPVRAGLHGLSNDSLDTPWPKVERSKSRMERMLASQPDQLIDALFDILADRSTADEDALPSTGIPIEWEKRLSAPFIVAGDYGTRASTVMVVANDGEVSVQERTFGSGGVELTRRAFSFGTATVTR